MLKPFATKIDKKDLDNLDHLAKETQMPKSRLVTQALHILFEFHRVSGKKSLLEKLKKARRELSRGQGYTLDQVSSRLRAIERKLGIA